VSVVSDFVRDKYVLVETSASFRCDKQSDLEYDTASSTSVPPLSTPEKPGPEQFRVANTTVLRGALNLINPPYKFSDSDAMRLNLSMTDSEELGG
jgi:hypothetical protein